MPKHVGSDHPVRVAPVDRVAGQRPQDQRTLGALSAAGLEDAVRSPALTHAVGAHPADRTAFVQHVGHDLLMGRLVVMAAQMVVVGAVLAVTGCAAPSRDSAAPPPAGASPSVVLDTYLRALVAGDCATAHAAATSAFATDPAELCGEVRVSAFSVRGGPATPDPNEVVYMTILTTNGSSDGTIAPGETDWFYGLEREGGEWRLVSGGSGP